MASLFVIFSIGCADDGEDGDAENVGNPQSNDASATDSTAGRATGDGAYELDCVGFFCHLGGLKFIVIETPIFGGTYLSDSTAAGDLA